MGKMKNSRATHSRSILGDDPDRSKHFYDRLNEGFPQQFQFACIMITRYICTMKSFWHKTIHSYWLIRSSIACSNLYIKLMVM